MVSMPVPPSNRSLPLPPLRVSLPANPESALSLPSPVSVSMKAVPVTFSMPMSVSVPAPIVFCGAAPRLRFTVTPPTAPVKASSTPVFVVVVVPLL